VVVKGSRIGGSVQIVQGGAARTVGNRITGDILFDDQVRLLANRNRIGGNLQASQNDGGCGSVTTGSMGTSNARRTSPPRRVVGTRWAATLGRPVRGSVTT
jgi:hypothetical protein